VILYVIAVLQYDFLVQIIYEIVI